MSFGSRRDFVLGPGARYGGDEDCDCPPEPHPVWGVLTAIAGGLAAGAAPTLAKVAIVKLFPEWFDEGDMAEEVAEEDGEDE